MVYHFVVLLKALFDIMVQQVECITVSLDIDMYVLWPSDAVGRHGSWLTLVQGIACRLIGQEQLFEPK